MLQAGFFAFHEFLLVKLSFEIKGFQDSFEPGGLTTIITVYG